MKKLLLLLFFMLPSCIIEVQYKQTIRVGTTQPTDTIYIDSLNYE